MKKYLLCLSFLFSFVLFNSFNYASASKRPPSGPSPAALPEFWISGSSDSDDFPTLPDLAPGNGIVDPPQVGLTSPSDLNMFRIYYNALHRKLFDTNRDFPRPNLVFSLPAEINKAYLDAYLNAELIKNPPGQNERLCFFIDLSNFNSATKTSCLSKALDWFNSVAWSGSKPVDIYIFFDQSPLEIMNERDGFLAQLDLPV